MENIKYESPKFEFQEMKLTEAVADTCWGYAYAWYDADMDGVIDVDKGEKVVLKDIGLGENGCQGSAARDALESYFEGKFPGLDLKKDDVSTNTDSRLIKPSNS